MDTWVNIGTCYFCTEEYCDECRLVNPCLGCEDYNVEKDKCKSKGGCADIKGED